MVKFTTLKRLNHICLALTTCTMLGIAMSKPAAALKYSITKIGTLEGSSSQAYGINDSGEVVGVYSLPKSQTPTAFVWDKTNGIQALKAATPGFFSQAYGINNNGLVVGCEFTNKGDQQAILWDRDNNAQLLGYLGNISPAQPKSVAYAINDNGLVVGASASLADTKLHAVLWNSTDDNQNNAQAILKTDTFGSIAYGINNYGQVVVSSGGGFQSFIWDSKTDLTQSLQSIRGNREPYDINNNGQAVGYSLTGNTSSEGTLWDTPNNIKSLGSGNIGYGINDNGWVVGRSSNNHAFVWVNGEAHDLNDLLIKPKSGWILNEARAINNSGQIAATGTINGKTHAFVLTPH
ncbi:MAG: DUF3466 family protein [Stigonema ocellatum SAG 48.90 = DSM 106950]|nr:DUF3466 family protein [Stigonema ocellatum SAG 48.90 = DSM 106950]